jgi:hypothetical protein
MEDNDSPLTIDQLAFKAGDKLEYIGPGRNIVQGERDHPSYYDQYVIKEILPLSWVDEFLLKRKHTVWARFSCVIKDRPDVKCGGCRYFNTKDWRIIKS